MANAHPPSMQTDHPHFLEKILKPEEEMKNILKSEEILKKVLKSEEEMKNVSESELILKKILKQGETISPWTPCLNLGKESTKEERKKGFWCDD